MLIKNKAQQGSLFFIIIARLSLFLVILSLGACSSTRNNYRYPLRQDKAPAFRINANKIPNDVT
jgi:hypothetical protein